MPAESKKQEMFMQAVANNPEFAKKVGVKQSIGQEFTKEKDMNKVKKMQMGGRAMADKAGAQAMDPRMAMAMEARRRAAAGGGMNKGGNTSRMNRLEELGRVDNEKAYTKKGKDNLMAEKKRVVGELKAKTGGMLASTGGSNAPMDAKGKKMMKGGKVKKMKKGGSVSSASKRADGVAQRGRTRGRMV